MELPNAVEYEKNLLSAMMVKEGEIIPAVTEKLSADDFYRPEHRIIFDAIVAVYNRGKPCNLMFVLPELESVGAFKSMERKYFLSLSALECTTVYAKSYAEVIKEMSLKRQIVALTDNVRAKAHNISVTVEELMSDVEKFLVKSDENKQSTFETSTEIATQVFERTKELSKTAGLTGVATGLWDLNEVTNGLQNGELILLAARPAMGKTALALNIAQGAANTGKVVAVFSLEMSKRQIGIRILSAQSGVEARKISTGKDLTEDDSARLLDALEDIDRHPVYVDDTSGLTVAAMRTKLRRFKQEHGLDLIVVDYLQLMQGNGENRVQEISSISRGLKALAKEFNVPVLALSQLSRNVEMRAEKKPQLSDLRDSGSLEQDADIVMFLYRDEYYNRDEDANKNVAELNIAKNRNGATATIELFFRKETLQFGDFIRDLPPKEA